MRLLGFVIVLGILLNQVSKADTMKDFVRISCIPEAGLLDIEYRGLHDSVAVSPNSPAERNAVLERAGFHSPRGLKFSCELGGTMYTISSKQDEPSERMCGASPEIYLSVMRGNSKILSDVVFGDSCHQLASVTRITAGDGKQSWRGRETQICYASGKDNEPAFRDWTFGAQAQFDKRLPIDQARVQRIVSHEEQR